MKILMAVHHFPPRYTGGAEWRAFRTAAALQQRGHEVQVICVENISAGARDGLLWDDGVFEGIPVRRLSYHRPAAADPFRWEYDHPWIGEHMRGFMAELRPDLFHLIGGYLISGSALSAAQEMAVPNVVTLTDFWFICPRITMLRSDGTVSTLPIQPETCARCLGEEQRRFRLPGRLFPGVMQAYWRGQRDSIQRISDRKVFLTGLLNQASAVICPSRFIKGIFSESGVSTEKLVYSRQGRDFPDLDPDLLEKTPGKTLRLGYLGQIAPQKGVRTLLEAVRRLEGVPLSLVVYGDLRPFPQYARRLEELAAGDERIRLAGSFHTSRLSQIFKDLDVVVVPSVWYENSPNVILEAFAHRTPVIASNLGGMAELVEDGKNGLLFAPGDVLDLAGVLQRLVDYPELIASLQAGIGLVRSVQEEMDELEAIYRFAVQELSEKDGVFE